ncbi:MAG: circularly permuted type 2 ATP-grasp protein [Pirellulales bacterium]
MLSPDTSKPFSPEPGSAVAALRSSILAGYTAPAGTYDELLAADGTVRPHWSRFLDGLQRLGSPEIRRRWDEAQLLADENAMAYSAYGDPTHQARPWQLDALPLVLSKHEWERVASGLRQRALLLDLVLQDLFGSQHLLLDGTLPADVLYRHPANLLPYHSLPAPRGRWLHYYAADLARSADGSWQVLGDRTEAPSGMGFALENRVIMSRMWPVVFRECYVQRLAPFFAAWQNWLRDLAPRNKENPRIVVLSQGPNSRNFFEDAYQARYLGYTVVESGDLSVRHGTVALKTLDGLLPVDVIFRRPNSETADPLELNGPADQGVPGLMQSVRGGHLAVVNQLGSGLVESPVMLAFLPRLCQRLLGEPLQLPSVSSWWCGDPESLAYVKLHLDDLVLKPAFRLRGQGHDYTQWLNHLPRPQLIELIDSDPGAIVAQEKVQRSTIPLWNEGRISSVYIALRSYLVAAEDSYHVLPGGLTRTSTTSDSLEASLQAGEGSKDTWVLDDAFVEPVSLLPPPTAPITLLRGRADLPSRVADNLFWLGRQLERTEVSARTLRTVVLRLTSEAAGAAHVELPALLRLLAEQGQIVHGYTDDQVRQQLPSIESALPRLVYDPQQAGSLRGCLNEVVRTASNVRDRISVDSWRIIVRIDEEAQPPADDSYDLTNLLNLTNGLILHLAAFSGMVMESMTRTHIFRLLDLGRRLERALQILQQVEQLLLSEQAIPTRVMEAALDIADSSMTYRTRYLANLRLGPVLDLLLTDETNPRSLAFQLVALDHHVSSLPHDRDQPTYSPQQRLAMSILHSIRMLDINQVGESAGHPEPRQLQHLVHDLQTRIRQLANVISLRYLVHAKPSHQLGGLLPYNE